jgi:hypothetical protein
MREVKVKRATPQETFDHMLGAGALSYSWWCDVHAVRGQGVDGLVTDDWEYLLTCETGKDDDSVKTATINHNVIMEAAKKAVLADLGVGEGTQFMSKACVRNCAALLYFPDDADFDANSSDELLQSIVLGQIVFG